MKYILPALFFLSFNSKAQVGREKECKTNVELEVVLDTIYAKIDTTHKPERNFTFVDYAATCNPCYQLRPLLDSYTVVSFTIESETAEGDISSVNVTGNTLSPYYAIAVFRNTKKGELVFFYCIRAKHTNGNVYTLRSFSMIKK